MAYEYAHILPQLVAIRAQETPDNIALQHVDGSTLTWDAGYSGALLWSDALERSGVAAGEPVVTLFANGFDAFRSWLGCGWLRAIEAPVNTAYKGTWLRHVINNTGAHLVLADARFVQPLFDIADELPEVKRVVVFGDMPVMVNVYPFEVISAAEFLEGAEARERSEPGPWDISSLIYTSGTTGLSKAVMVPWAQFHSSFESGMFPVNEGFGATTYSFYPPFHVTGKAGFYNPAAYQGKAVLREVFSTKDFWNDVKTYDATFAIILPPMAHFLMAEPDGVDDADNPMKTVVMAPVIANIDAFKKRFDLEVYTTYNMSEINCPIVRPEEPCNSNNYQSCGQVRDGVEVRIVDENDLVVPPNTIGEMIVRGEPWELNVGYWNMPEKTAEAWRNGWFHTGDAFTYDEDGNYYFVDRVKDYIRRRGENISSFEVESVVNEYPGVLASGAVAVPADESEDEVKIAVMLKSGVDFDPADLIRFLVPRMPRFAIPRYVEVWDELPTTEATARIQKAKIRDAGVSERTWDRIAAGVDIRG